MSRQRRSLRSLACCAESISASLSAAAALYLVLQSACVRGLGGALQFSTAPLADAAAAFGGARLRRLLVVGTSLSALGIAFGYMR